MAELPCACTIEFRAAVLRSTRIARITSGFVLLLLVSAPAWSATFVQSKSQMSSSGASSWTLAFNGNVTSGDAIVGYVQWSSDTVTLDSVTAGCATFTLLDNPTTDSTNQRRAATFYASNISGGTTCTITYTFSAWVNSTWLIQHEVSGVDASSPLAGHALQFQHLPGTDTDAISSGSITTTVSGAYIFGTTSDAGYNSVVDAGTGYTGRESGSNGLRSEDRIQTSAGSIAATFTEQAQAWADYATAIVALTPTSATTITAASCSRQDVQTAVNAANENGGDTVAIPAGSCTWTSSVSITKPLTLQGAGQTSTVISASGTDLITLNPSVAGAVRVTTLGFTGTNSFGAIQFDGVYSSLRMDHVTFTNLSQRAVIIGYNTWSNPGAAPIYGLFDHITYSNTSSVPFVLHYGVDDSWLAADDYGSPNAFYVEDSTFTFPATSNSVNSDVWDAEHGGRYVIRHNTVTNGVVMGHDTGSTPQARGQRKYEIYSNTFSCTTSDCGNSAMSLRGGTGVMYDNSIAIYPNGFENATFTEIWRLGRGSAPWNFACNAAQSRICSSFRSFCSNPPYGPCGTYSTPGNPCDPVHEGTGTCTNNCTQDSQCGTGNVCLSFIDGTDTTGGYACRDQVGRGQDNTDNTQRLSPVYWWNNTDSNNFGSQITTINVATSDTGYIQSERDYYTYMSSFDGTAGVGRGLLANRPATCAPLTAYFATDTSTLYQCSSANTWTAYYSAYTYPHPLQGS